MIFTRLQSSLLLLLAAAAAPALAQSSSDLGCFTDDTGTLASVYLYQSSGYCASNCSESNYFYIRGKSCYCTNTKPSSSASDCTTPCPGFGTVMCGGSDSYSYWENLLYMGNTNLESTSSSATSTSQSTLISSFVSSSSSKVIKSSTSTTSSSSTSSSSTSSTSTTSSETTSESTTSSVSQTPIVVTISGKETIYVTATQSTPTASTAEASATSSVLDATTQEKSSSGGGVSGGAIAGIVIGVVAGFAAIILVLIFLWRRNSTRGSNHDNYTGGTKSPTTFSDPFGVMVEDKASFGLSPPHQHANNLPNRMNSNNNSSGDNNFMAVDQRLNPVMLGDRRLSEGSIADERDYSRKILRVANPDA